MSRFYIQLILLIGIVLGCNRTRIGEIVTLASFDDRNHDIIAQVLSRYNGWQGGHDVAFFCRRQDEGWMGFYLEHESPCWNSTKIIPDSGGILLIQHDGHNVAEFNTVTGIFKHFGQKHVYSREDGVAGGKEAATWGLQTGRTRESAGVHLEKSP